jgi:hypothetical protein
MATNFKMPTGHPYRPGTKAKMIAMVEVNHDGTGTMHELDGRPMESPSLGGSGWSGSSVPEGMSANKVPYDGGPQRLYTLPKPFETTKTAQAFRAKMADTGEYIQDYLKD